MEYDWWSQPVQELDRQMEQRALQRQAQLTKPRGSLGRLETLAVRLAAMQGTLKPNVDSAAISVFAADHGVAEEGVSAFPQAVTAQMVANFAAGGAAICVLARQHDALFEVVNLGTVEPLPPQTGVVDARVAAGTANFCRAEAMTAGQLTEALQAGADAAERAHRAGARLFIGGEMGIANTTAATALASALLQLAPDQLAGPGTGIDAQGVSHKVRVIERGLELHRAKLKDALSGLRCLGGFEIAALAGAYIRCAQLGVAVLVDGFITTAAALAAVRLNPGLRDWLIFSHGSAEPGHRKLLAALDADPLVDLGMRLGEASGAALVVPLLRSACALHGEMATFEEAAVHGSH